MIGLPEAARMRAESTRLCVLDVDGVLTDGHLYYGVEGEAFKSFHVRDGLGIKLLQHHGIEVAVISARESALVKTRMSDLGITRWFTGRGDKVGALEQVLRELSLTAAQVAYVGDDLLDAPVMRRVGLAVAVGDAHPFIKSLAHWVTQADGGQGAIREVADGILEAQGGLANAYEKFLHTALGARATEKA